jgi:hypothetical protein
MHFLQEMAHLDDLHGERAEIGGQMGDVAGADRMQGGQQEREDIG